MYILKEQDHTLKKAFIFSAVSETHFTQIQYIFMANLYQHI